jgi:hypothetical protein
MSLEVYALAEAGSEVLQQWRLCTMRGTMHAI